MKVKVKDLEPNPYRNMEKYPIDPYKVEALKNSISETEFWDNLLARKRDDKYQIAYGHHRLIALRESGIKEIDIPIRDLDDARMIQIMANENMNEWKMSPSIVLETVKVTRDFLNAELAKYESWEDAPQGLINLLNLGDGGAFENIKTKGVGQTTILKFLGKNWKQHLIQDALETLDSQEVSRAAVETFDTVSTAKEFKRAVKEIAKENKKSIPKEKQEELAKGIQKRIEQRKGAGGGKSHRASMKTMLRQELGGESEQSAEMRNLEVDINNVMQKCRQCATAVLVLNGKLSDLEVKDIGGLQGLIALDTLSDVLRAIRKLITFFGYDYKNLLIGGENEE